MRFNHAYFIVGTAYAGKSTMIRLLAEKYNGILCEENYHDRFFHDLDKAEFPCLTYTRELKDWHDFIRRTPEEYEKWIDGVSKECEILEFRILKDLMRSGRPVFVDTNISVAALKEVAAPDHVLVMLADPQISVRRFFERPHGVRRSPETGRMYSRHVGKGKDKRRGHEEILRKRHTFERTFGKSRQ